MSHIKHTVSGERKTESKRLRLMKARKTENKHETKMQEAEAKMMLCFSGIPDDEDTA